MIHIKIAKIHAPYVKQLYKKFAYIVRQSSAGADSLRKIIRSKEEQLVLLVKIHQPRIHEVEDCKNQQSKYRSGYDFEFHCQKTAVMIVNKKIIKTRC